MEYPQASLSSKSTTLFSRLRRLVTAVCWLVLWAALLGFFLWACGGMCFLPYLPTWLARILAAAYALTGLWLLVRTRPKRKWLAYSALGAIAVYGLLLLHRPTHNRDWAPDHGRLPQMEIEGNAVQLSDFRQFRYESETDYTPDWNTLQFELDDISAVWFGVQRFTTLEGIAHTFLSFRADTNQGPKFVCVSVEVRREKDESWSPTRGFYRQYELIYVVSDERDEIAMRTVHRPNDRVFLFPVNATPEQAQALFVEVAGRVNRLKTHPEFYNSFFNNCTNNLAVHTSRLNPDISILDRRIMIPGYSDRFAFAKGLIGTGSETFKQMRDRCRVDQIAREFGDRDGFSEAIRRNLNQTPAAKP